MLIIIGNRQSCLYVGAAVSLRAASQGSLPVEVVGDAEEAEEGLEGEEEVEGAEGEGVDLGEEGEGDEEEKTDALQEKGGSSPRPGKAKKLTNQFNFCERAALTYNNPDRVSLHCLLFPSRMSKTLWLDIQKTNPGYHVLK